MAGRGHVISALRVASKSSRHVTAQSGDMGAYDFLSLSLCPSCPHAEHTGPSNLIPIMAQLICPTSGCPYTTRSAKSMGKHVCKLALEVINEALSKRRRKASRRARKRARRDSAGNYHGSYGNVSRS